MTDSNALGTPYSLTVMNQNSQVTHFALYQEVPTVVGPSVNFLSLAWMVGTAAPGSPTNPAESEFDWTIDYSVMTGYVQSQGDAAHPRRFNTSSHKDVKIVTDNALAVTYAKDPNAPGVPYFPKDATNGEPGEVQIQSDDSIPTHADQASTRTVVSLGLAMDNRVAVVVELVPNMLHQFTPKPTYYIIAGSFIQGQVVDSSMTTHRFEVKFDGTTSKTIVFTEKNVFQDA